MRYKIKPLFLIFEDKATDYKIYKANLIDRDNLSEETIIGEMQSLCLGVQYEIEAEQEINNYGKQYRIKDIYKDDYNEKDEQLLFVELFGKRLFNRIIKKTKYPMTAIENNKVSNTWVEGKAYLVYKGEMA